MFRHTCLLIAILLALSTIQTVIARKSGGGRGGSHSYPSSHGLSGGGHHSGGLSGGSHGYPSSGGHSGGSHTYPSSGGNSGGSHTYPSSGGNSGGSHTYPSSGGNSGGSHGYPSSGGISGTSGGHSSYPSGGNSGGTHTYPSSGGSHSMSGSHSYPAGNGLSGGSSSSTNVHHHYHYSPPQQIRYTPTYGPAVTYPVYRGTPPTYVYHYQDSGSKYGTLLAGLALFNLGALAGNAYGHSHSSTSYKPQPGEVCKFGIKKDNGDYEETKINCEIISSFIFQEQANTQNAANNKTTVVTTTVTNVTTVNNNGVAQAPALAPAAGPVNVTFTMLPNGTLVPQNNITYTMTSNGTLVPQNLPSNNNNSTSSVTVTTTNTTTVTNALDVKGPPVAVTPGMQCYVIRHTSSSNMKRSVPCGVLQSYATQSLKKNSAAMVISQFTLLLVSAAILVFN